MTSALPIVEVWATRNNKSLYDWSRAVSDVFANSQISLISASKILGVHPAELFAVLNLATLEDKNLQKISEVNPPITTWLSLSKANEEGIVAGLEALSRMQKSKNKSSPCMVVDDAIESVGGGGPSTRVSKLTGEVISHAAKKAVDYNALNPVARGALKRFGSMRKSGKIMTPKQIGYLQSLLEDLVKRGVIKANSPDGDQEICDQIIKALE